MTKFAQYSERYAKNAEKRKKHKMHVHIVVYKLYMACECMKCTLNEILNVKSELRA